MKQTITVDIEGNALDLAEKKKAIEAVATLSADNAKLITELATNPKYLAGLNKHKTMLKAML